MGGGTASLLMPEFRGDKYLETSFFDVLKRWMCIVFVVEIFLFFL